MYFVSQSLKYSCSQRWHGRVRDEVTKGKSYSNNFANAMGGGGVDLQIEDIFYVTSIQMSKLYPLCPPCSIPRPHTHTEHDATQIVTKHKLS